MTLNTQSLGLLAGMDDAALKRRTKTEPYRALWCYFTGRYEGMLERMHEDGKRFSQGVCGWHSITPLVIEAGLINRLTDDASALAWIEESVEVLATAYREPDGSLGAAGSGTRRAMVMSHLELALGADLCRHRLTPSTRKLVQDLMRDICIPFSGLPESLTGFGCGANIPLYRAAVAGLCALTWGEESGFADWEKVCDMSVTAVRQFLRHGCDEDGFPFEGLGYGHGVFDLLYLFAQVMKQSGRVDLFASEPVLGRIPDASRQMLFPNAGSLGSTNDTGTRSPWSIPWLHLTAAVWNRPDQIGFWEAFCGPDTPNKPYGDIWPWHARLLGQDERFIEHCDLGLVLNFLWWRAERPLAPLEACPLPTADRASRAGIAAFRTDWGREAVFVSMLASGRSHCCHGHAHNDCGHVNFVVGGEYLAIDTGRYNDNEDQHSVILIDGRNAAGKSENHWGGLSKGVQQCDAPAGRITAFQRHPMVDYCKVDAALQKNCRWADRHLLFIRCGRGDAYTVLVDNINPDDQPHDYVWQLQLNPEASITIDGPRQATVEGKDARLEISFALKPPVIDSKLERTDLSLRHDIREWSWPYGRNQDTTVLEAIGLMSTSVRRPRLLAERRAENGQFTAVIVPRRKDQPPLRVTDCSTPKLFRIRVTGDGWEDTVIAALDHALIDLDEAFGFTEFALVRRNPAGQILGIWTVNGAALELAGGLDL